MCYIVYQKEGKLADAAREYEQARIAGRMDDAVEIYLRATGDKRELPPLDDCWWTNNAGAVIRRTHNVTNADVRRYLRRAPDAHISDKDYARAVCALAARKHGGKWDYYYEY